MVGQASRIGVNVSPREAEVFDLLGEHLTHAEIGERLFISVRTVESHVASLRRKLGGLDHRSLVRAAADQRSYHTTSVVPQEASSFIGRQAELEAVANALASSRVVSLVGAGGTGKTRLAIRSARQLSADASSTIVWVDLAAVTSPSAMASTLAGALGIVEPGRQTYEMAVLNALGRRGGLLVLDNCEQILDEVALTVERILGACADVSFLLTSRIRLAVPHERVIQLGGLAVGSAQEPGAAVELFVERARAGGAELGAVDTPRAVEICRALDGMPLAIELAAALVPSIGLGGVESGLGDHRRLLVGGARVQARHRSVSDTVGWSYRLLDPVDQQVLARLSAFRKSFSATDAQAVVAYDRVPAADVVGALGRLARHSLIEPEASDGELRYRVLETVRQFGAEQLLAVGDSTAAERHLEWCSCRAAELAGQDDGPSWEAAVDTAVEEGAAALSSTMSDRGSAEAHELALQLAALLFSRGRVTDSQHAFERAARLAETEIVEAADLTRAAAVAKCRVAGSDALRLEELATRQALVGGDADLAVHCLASSAQLIARFPGMFDEPPPIERAQSLLEGAKGHPARNPAAQFTLEATAAALDPNRDIDELERLVDVALKLGEVVQASALLDEIVARHIESGNPINALSVCRRRLDLLDGSGSQPDLGLELKDALHTAVFTATGAGELVEAMQLSRDHALLPFLRDERGLALEEGIAPAALAGDWDLAIEAGEAFRVGWEQAGRPVAPGRSLGPAALAMLHGIRGDDAERASWLETLQVLRGADHAHRATGVDEIFDAIFDLHNDRNERAADRLAAYEADRFLGALFRPWHAALEAEAAVLGGRPDAVAKVEFANETAEYNPVAAALTRRAQALQVGATERMQSIAEHLDDLGCPYQAARTLLLAGGPDAERGVTRLSSLGAAVA